MKSILIKIRDRLLGWKVNVLRSAGYISFLNLGMIMYLTFGKYIGDNIATVAALYIVTIIALGVFGYYDLKYFKGQRVETDYLNKFTPVHPDIAEMKRKVDELYARMK